MLRRDVLAGVSTSVIMTASQAAVLPFGFFEPPDTNLFSASVIKSRSGSIIITPAYPKDRIVSGPWLAIAAVNDFVHDSTNAIYATPNFPNGTRFMSTYPANDGRTVSAFIFMDYGNYLDSIATITPKQISSVETLNMTWISTLTEDVGAVNGCIDFFLFSDKSGTTAKQIREIQIYWDTPARTLKAFLGNLPVVGIYTSAAIGSTPAQHWQVTYQAPSTSGNDYYQFRLFDGTDASLTMHAGSFDILAAMRWLQSQPKPNQSVKYCLSGQEYYCGHGFGYEILKNSVTLDISSISVNYS